MAATDKRYTSVSTANASQRESFIWSKPNQAPEWVNGSIAGEPDQVAAYRREQRWLLVHFPTNLREADDRGLPVFGAQVKSHYYPLETNPELFRTFGSLATSEDAYQGFAAKFGYLGIRETINAEYQGHSARAIGEGYWTWAWNHQVMRSLLLVYDAAREGRTSDLKRWLLVSEMGETHLRIRLAPGSEVNIPPARCLNVGARSLFAIVKVTASSPAERMKRIALRWVSNAISIQVAGAPFPECIVSAGLVRINDQYDHAIRLRPESLMGAMWLQFAKAIEGNLDYQQCRNCQRWLLRSTQSGGKRSDAKYCSEGCRLQHWRNRKARRKAR